MKKSMLTRFSNLGMRHLSWLVRTLWLGALLSSAQAYASGSEALKTFVTQVHAARGKFVQRQITQSTEQNVPAASMQAARTLSGTFVFLRPGKFIWAYQKPYAQILQADGKYFYVYDQDLNQVTRRKLDQALSGSSATILFGSNDLSRDFKLRDAGTQQGIDWLELIPKTQDSQFQRISIGFRQGNLAAMKLHDSFGNLTELTFSQIEKNPPLSADQFKFTVPPGAELVNG